MEDRVRDRESPVRDTTVRTDVYSDTPVSGHTCAPVLPGQTPRSGSRTSPTLPWHTQMFRNSSNRTKTQVPKFHSLGPYVSTLPVQTGTLVRVHCPGPMTRHSSVCGPRISSGLFGPTWTIPSTSRTTERWKSEGLSPRSPAPCDQDLWFYQKGVPFTPVSLVGVPGSGSRPLVTRLTHSVLRPDIRTGSRRSRSPHGNRDPFRVGSKPRKDRRTGPVRRKKNDPSKGSGDPTGVGELVA